MAGSTAKIAMLSWPRFEPYTNFPSGRTAISAVSVGSVKPAGTVESVCCSASAPVRASYENAVTVDCISLMTYMWRPSGWNAAWRGPAPGASRAAGGWLGVSPPVAGSNR